MFIIQTKDHVNGMRFLNFDHVRGTLDEVVTVLLDDIGCTLAATEASWGWLQLHEGVFYFSNKEIPSDFTKYDSLFNPDTFPVSAQPDSWDGLREYLKTHKTIFLLWASRAPITYTILERSEAEIATLKTFRCPKYGSVPFDHEIKRAQTLYPNVSSLF